MDNKAAGQYLARVKRALVCDKTDRCRLLERCADMIGVFQQENPEAGYDGIVAAFGEPDAFVAELLSGLDEATVKVARKRRRLIRWGAMAAIIAALIALSAFLYIKYWQSMKPTEVDEYFYAVISPPQKITPEEFNHEWETTPEEAQAGAWKGLPE